MADLTNLRRHGFTMLELIAVLVVMGIIATAAMSSVDFSPYDVTSEAETFKANLRFAQTLGFAQGELPPGSDDNIWGIQLSGGSYSLTMNGSAQNTVNMPGQTSATYTLPDNVTITGSTMNFDFRGRPVSAVNAPIGGDTMYTVSDGSTSVTVTVLQNTGVVQ